MYKTENATIISFFVGSCGYLVPRFKSDNVKISKTIKPYLLGKRDLCHLYDLEKSLYCIRATLEVLETMIEQDSDILFVNSSPILKYAFDKNINMACVKWKRGVLSKFKGVDLVFLSDIREENLVEAHRECLLLVGVGSSTTSRMSYLFNLNMEDTLLSYWFFNLLTIISHRGKKKLRRQIMFPSLLGKGRSERFDSYAV